MKSPIPAVIAIVLCSTLISQSALVSHWKFDESSGTFAADSAGSYSGNLSGGAMFVTGGISGNAVSLEEASDSFVDMGNGFPGFITDDFSIMTWVKTNTMDPDTILVSKHYGGQFAGYFLGVNANNVYGAPDKAWFYATSTAGNGPISTTSVNDGQWHQIVGVYKAGLSTAIYVDGAPVETSQSAQAIGANSAEFLVGGFVSGGIPTATFTGLIDEVQVYSAALSDSEIQFLYNNPGLSVPEPASLVLLMGAGFIFLGSRRRASILS